MISKKDFIIGDTFDSSQKKEAEKYVGYFGYFSEYGAGTGAFGTLEEITECHVTCFRLKELVVNNYYTNFTPILGLLSAQEGKL